MKIIRIGIDWAKNVFQAHGVDRHGKTVWRRRLRRNQWLEAVLDRAEPGCVMGIESLCRCPSLGSRASVSRLCRQIDTPTVRQALREEQ